MLMFGVFDVKAETFGLPFFKQAKGQAVRDFKILCNDPSSVPGKFPEDFKLFYLGEFDEATGVVRCESPEVICTGMQVSDSAVADIRRKA